MSAPPLTPGQRAALASLADRIVPRAAEMPSAGDLGLAEAGGLIDRVLTLRPDLGSDLRRLLDSPAYREPETLAAAELGVLMQVVAGAYYMHPVVRARIHYPGQEAQVLRRDGIGAEDLLAIMMERPPRWRPVASTPAANPVTRQ